MSIDKHNTG